MSYLSKFRSYAEMEFKTGIAYRFQFMASIVISPLILLLYYFVWQAIYSNNQTSIMGYSFSDMITYYVLMMVIGHFIFNMVGNDLQEKILYGDLSQDMLKPFSIFSQFLSRTIADRGFAFVTEVLPVFIISFLIFKLQIVSIAAICFFMLSLIFSFFINFLINFLMGVLSFWVSRVDSIQWLFFFFIRFLSGEFIPLDFLGATVLGILKWLPFYYIRYGLVQVYLGKLSLIELAEFFGMQIAWIVILYIFTRVLLNIALKRYGAQGG